MQLFHVHPGSGLFRCKLLNLFDSRFQDGQDGQEYRFPVHVRDLAYAEKTTVLHFCPVRDSWAIRKRIDPYLPLCFQCIHF